MKKSKDIETRWWGWGDVQKKYPIEDMPNYVPYIEKRLNLNVEKLRAPDPNLDDLKLRESRLKEKSLEKLASIVGKENVSTTKRDRVYHAMGKSYRDLLRARLGDIPNPPDAVIFPGSEEEVVKLLQLAGEESLGIVPFCGGSSVVGGVEPLERAGLSGTITIDLRRMDKVLSVDSISRRARFEAGIWGPELEDELSKHGLYLGHGPESFLFSGLGGWLASRSAGRQSTGYGKIERMVESIRMVTPQGIIETKDVPASAAGPELNQLICGSEGTLGIITEATMKVRPLPEVYDYRGFLLKRFEDGVEAAREIMQGSSIPETIRLSDLEESSLAVRLRRPSSNPKKEQAMQMGLKALESLGRGFGDSAFCILGCEGNKAEVFERRSKITSVLLKRGAIPLGKAAGMEWYETRFDHPYLRDIMMGWGMLVDTLETSTTWDNVINLYKAVGDAIRQGLADFDSEAIVTCHLSHAYPTGSSLYFIILGKQAPGRELEQWEHMKKMASDAIVKNGGTITHHHGVGYEHAPWLEKEYGEAAMNALKALKRELDPKGIMNPGKLGL